MQYFRKTTREIGLWRNPKIQLQTLPNGRSVLSTFDKITFNE